MHRALVISVAAVCLGGLSGCGASSGKATTSPGSVTVKDRNGAVINVAGGADAAKPPPFVAVYPGAQVEATISGVNGDTGKGGTVVFHTTAKPADVLAFYQQKAVTAGFKPTMTTQSGDGFMFSAGTENGETAVQVIASPDKGSTAVQVFWTQPKAG